MPQQEQFASADADPVRLVGWRLFCSFSAGLGMFVTWRVPGLELYARNWLTRARGPLPVPDDIAIVAIDEASLARFGRYPWRRNLTAQMLDHLAVAHPQGLSHWMSYSAKPQTVQTTPHSLQRFAKAGKRRHRGPTHTHGIRPSGLASAIVLRRKRRAGRGWTRACFRTEADGVAGSFLVRQADDQGQAEWAMALENHFASEKVRTISLFKSCLGQFPSADAHSRCDPKTRRIENRIWPPAETHSACGQVGFPSNTSVRPVPLRPTHSASVMFSMGKCPPHRRSRGKYVNRRGHGRRR